MTDRSIFFPACFINCERLTPFGFNRFSGSTIRRLFTCILEFPDIQALFYILGGALLHSGYQIALMHAYRFGDLTQIYPIARGLSPLLLMLATLIIGQDILSDMQILAIILVAVSLFVFGLSQLRARESGLVSLVMAVTAGIFIASYSFVDAIGARLSQNAVSYYSVMSFLNALIMLVYFT
ncbi:MAG: hypothetical protein VW417_07665, partial [Alphaproteobacteria bacterium]